jgi:hypothetical protein
MGFRERPLTQSRNADVVTRAIGVVLSAILLAACSGSATTPSQTTACPGALVSTGSMTAQVDGVAWAAVCVPPAGNAVKFGYLDVSGYDAGKGLAFRVHAGGPTDLPGSVPLTVGTYQLGGPSSAYGNDSYVLWGPQCKPPVSQCPLWEAQAEFGTGTITIATLTDTTATGTFSFNLFPVPISGATDVMTITNGFFRVTF